MQQSRSEETTRGTDSESVGTDSESPPPQTPSRPNKIQKNKIHEQALRHAQEREPDDAFTFEEPALATDKQITLLRDLAIIVTHQIPNDMQTARWRKLTRHDAHIQIRGYLRNTGVGGMWTGPTEGTPLWNELSPLTQAWYLAGALPGGLEGAA
ncbi:hypothetical protein [Microbacterium sp. oral taxon 186]|uniref:hypothetical protein n=1 Tax=Microbacterium sp. oral taxon 186 TaxID=712383 RepID=UPI0018DD88B0|nr:hypothetical protein [Microbacterium sp. oral taxon 186]